MKKFQHMELSLPQGEGINGLYSVETFVEKPAPEEAPSDLAIIGRYLLTPEIFEILEIKLLALEMKSSLPMLLIHLIKHNVFSPVNLQELVTTSGISLALWKPSIDFALKHPESQRWLERLPHPTGKRIGWERITKSFI